MNTRPCTNCGAILRAYWLKNGQCNGCRNPHLIVECIQVLPHPPEVIDVDPAVIERMEQRLNEPKPDPKPLSIFDRD